jgi:hypothetical protein
MQKDEIAGGAGDQQKGPPSCVFTYKKEKKISKTSNR